MASNTRKKVFPKKPQPLNQKTISQLGINSNTAGYFASLEAIYNRPTPPKKVGDSLTPHELKRLQNFKKHLAEN